MKSLSKLTLPLTSAVSMAVTNFGVLMPMTAFVTTTTTNNITYKLSDKPYDAVLDSA